VAAALAAAALVALGRPSSPPDPPPARTAGAAGAVRLFPSARVSGCARGRWARLKLKAGHTPIVGRSLPLDVAVTNAYAPGPFRCWIRIPTGAAEPEDGAADWKFELGPGQSVALAVSTRVLSKLPFVVTANLASLAAPYHDVPELQAHLELFPLESDGETTKANWDPKTLRPLGESPPRMLALPDGQEAVVFRVLTADAVAVTRPADGPR
jgi:hypothetical protein